MKLTPRIKLANNTGMGFLETEIFALAECGVMDFDHTASSLWFVRLQFILLLSIDFFKGEFGFFPLIVMFYWWSISLRELLTGYSLQLVSMGCWNAMEIASFLSLTMFGNKSKPICMFCRFIDNVPVFLLIACDNLNPFVQKFIHSVWNINTEKIEI